MAGDGRNAQLLRSITEALGVDAEVFSGGHTEEQSASSEYHSAVLLTRLLRAFRSLPNDDKRLEALRFVEELAAGEA